MSDRARRSPSSERPPGGGRRPSRELVAEDQRWRLIRAAAEVGAERGYARVTGRVVTRRAAVSPSALYQHFGNLEACLVASCEMAADSLRDLVVAACAGPGERSQRLRAAVEAGLEYAASEPVFSRLLGFEAAAAVTAIAIARQRLLLRLGDLLRGDRPATAAGELPARLELHLLAGAFSLVTGRLAAGETVFPPDLAAHLAALLSLPFAQPEGVHPQ